MIEKIAMWGGVAGIIISVFAIIILFLTRSNIIDILDRDVIMYDKNYELKKDALQKAFTCLDYIAANGTEVKNTPQYIQKAKEAYNGLVCTVNSPKVYQEFYKLAIDNMVDNYTIEDIEKFKIACRIELVGRKKKSGEGFKGAVSGGLNNGSINPMRSMAPQRPQQIPTSQQPQPLRHAQPKPPQAAAAQAPKVYVPQDEEES